MYQIWTANRWLEASEPGIKHVGKCKTKNIDFQVKEPVFGPKENSCFPKVRHQYFPTHSHVLLLIKMSPFMLSLDLSLPEERPIDLVLRSMLKEITKSLSHGAWSSAMYTRREPAGTSIGIPDSTSIEIIVGFFYKIAASIASLKTFHWVDAGMWEFMTSWSKHRSKYTWHPLAACKKAFAQLAP